MLDSCRMHTKTDGSWWEKDGRGIPLARVCRKCRKEKLSKYRTDIKTRYATDERIEVDY